jgi:hypothetical protein
MHVHWYTVACCISTERVIFYHSYRESWINNHNFVYLLIDIDPDIMFVFTAIMGCGLFKQTALDLP